MASDAELHDKQNSTVPCRVTAAVQVWKYEPFWLVLPYAIAVGATLLTLLVGVHGFVSNGYAADTGFSTFVTTTRSKDLDDWATGPRTKFSWRRSSSLARSTWAGPIRMWHLRSQTV